LRLLLTSEREGGPEKNASRGTSTSADGSFRFAGGGSGSFRLAACLDGVLPAVSEVISGGVRGPLELRLRAAASIQGMVVRPDGSPVEGAVVRAAWKERTQDARDAGRREE